MTEASENDAILTAEQELLIASLPLETVSQIDQIILAKIDRQFRKVAKIVGSMMQSFPDLPEGYFVKRIIKLAESGLIESQGNLHRMRFSEVRVPSPPLTENALNDLIATGQFSTLGSLYEDGQGVPKDYKEAMKWYLKSANQGKVWSQFSVGRFYKEGYGVIKNNKQAYFWFAVAEKLATSASNPFALFKREIASEMNSEEIEEMQKLAEQWQPTID